jgi:hypothetical protein
MAIARDSSYRDHAPSDIQRLVSEIEKKEGIDIPEPVWTVGRLDERASRTEAPEAESEPKENSAEDTPAEEQGDAAVDQDHEAT